MNSPVGTISHFQLDERFMPTPGFNAATQDTIPTQDQVELSVTLQVTIPLLLIQAICDVGIKSC